MIALTPGQSLMVAVLILVFVVVMLISINSDENERTSRASHQQLLRELRNKDRDGNLRHETNASVPTQERNSHGER